MSVSGLCQLCERAPAIRRCDLCGNLVCDVHYDVAAGACAECVAGGRASGATGTR